MLRCENNPCVCGDCHSIDTTWIEIFKALFGDLGWRTWSLFGAAVALNLGVLVWKFV